MKEITEASASVGLLLATAVAHEVTNQVVLSEISVLDKKSSHKGRVFCS